jgi:hypothetical protein
MCSYIFKTVLKGIKAYSGVITGAPCIKLKKWDPEISRTPQGPQIPSYTLQC